MRLHGGADLQSKPKLQFFTNFSAENMEMQEVENEADQTDEANRTHTFLKRKTIVMGLMDMSAFTADAHQLKVKLNDPTIEHDNFYYFHLGCLILSVLSCKHTSSNIWKLR